MGEVHAAAALRADVSLGDISDIGDLIRLEVLLVDAGVVTAGLVCADDEVRHIGNFLIHDKFASDADRAGKAYFRMSYLDDCLGLGELYFIGAVQLS